MLEAKEDADAYDLAIEAHHSAAEGYELAQLCAEVGVVVASIALLLSSRAVWLVAVLIGLGGGVVIGKTTITSRRQMEDARHKIELAEKHIMELDKED
jgi:hypothetical protein